MARFSRIGTRTGMVSTLVIFKSEYELQPELQLPRVSGGKDLARGRRGKTRIGRPKVDLVQSMNISQRNCRYFFSVNWKFLVRLLSRVAMPGPVMIPTPELPN